MVKLPTRDVLATVSTSVAKPTVANVDMSAIGRGVAAGAEAFARGMAEAQASLHRSLSAKLQQRDTSGYENWMVNRQMEELEDREKVKLIKLKYGTSEEPYYRGAGSRYTPSPSREPVPSASDFMPRIVPSVTEEAAEPVEDDKPVEPIKPFRWDRRISR